MEESSGTRRINQYAFRTSDLLGKGATGLVYFGQDTNNGLKVAVKVIDMSKIDNEVTVYLLSNEKRALQTLKHPNVIHTLDIIQEQDYCYIITEFCNEGTLSDLIQNQGRLSEDESLILFRKISEGYRVCVQHGIIHRDIKPANVLMSDGVPKLSDFGYCEIIGIQKPKIFYNVGSPSYMSPEAFVVNLYSEKSDVWSLGVLLYEMIVGQTFDGGGDIMECISNVGKFGVPYPPHVSAYCRHVINQCLNLDPTKRIGLETLINILENRDMVTQELTKSRSSRSIENVPVAQQPSLKRIITEGNIQAQQQQQQQIHRSNTLKMLPSPQIIHQQTQKQIAPQMPQVQQINQMQQRHQQIAQIPMIQQRPELHLQKMQVARQQANRNIQIDLRQMVRPTTQHESFQTNHYQQIYQQALHQQQQNSSRSAQEQHVLPRLLSHHVRLQNYEQPNHVYPQRNEVQKPPSKQGPPQQPILRKVPSLETALLKAKSQYNTALAQSMDVLPRNSQRAIVIPTQRTIANPPLSYRSLTITEAPQRPMTQFVSQPQPQRCVTAANFDGRDKLVRSVINPGGIIQQLPPQFTQKAFQKPQTVSITEGIKPDPQHLFNFNNQYSSPQRISDQTSKKQINNSPISPIYSAEVSATHHEPSPKPVVMQAQTASFKKPTIVRSVTQTTAPVYNMHPPNPIRQVNHAAYHPPSNTVTTNNMLPQNRGNPLARGPTSNRVVPVQKVVNGLLPPTNQQAPGHFRPVR